MQGTCYFKPQGSTPVVKPGVISCWPAGDGPVPTPPPPQPAPPQQRENHGPYQHGDGDGFQAVNSAGASKEAFGGLLRSYLPVPFTLPPPLPAVPFVGITLPPALYPEYIIGPGQYGTFTSEFGCGMLLEEGLRLTSKGWRSKSSAMQSA